MKQYNVGAPFKELPLILLTVSPVRVRDCYLLPPRDYFKRADDTVEDYSLKLATRIDAIHDEARKKLQFESDRLKTRYDARSNNSGYQAGDEVWLYNPARKKGRSAQTPEDMGSYTVIKRINDLVYRIQRGPRAKIKVVHLDRLAPYRRPHEELVDRDDHP
ncbi:hypothetical protein NQ317_009559 [Molorchus minor]|uniref:Integrase p58-like C-terminal domain-containing protein n=1 Tax=Molorchus minor TaxID=1323400 RepID=A0ABQ9JIW9_9CUCU|nr:hypothetical protein NQ317_009559 [Molorchus minor]